MEGADGTAILAEINRRLGNLEIRAGQTETRADVLESHTQLPHSRGISTAILELEKFVETLKSDPPAAQSAVEALVESKMTASAMLAAAAAATAQASTSDPLNTRTQERKQWPVLESKAIQDIGKISEAKGYRQWNKKMKNAWNKPDPNQDGRQS